MDQEAPELRTVAAINAIRDSDVIIGYNTYINLISDLINGKEVIRSRMHEEVMRAKLAIEKALDGHVVSLVSGGDPQVYGLASLVLELISKEELDLRPTVIPGGVTAALAAAARLGAPLNMDFAVVNLSNLLVSDEEIMMRIRAAASGDFVIALYNPISKDVLIKAMNLISMFRNASTPVGIVRNAYRDGEFVITTNLGNWMRYLEVIDMNTTLIIGNSRTYVYRGLMITPRGYRV
ncbi:precorrin-3B C(17)-methyltransferase [Vulcanisaeta distributa]|uniref:precorrin-3B C(17)-methyltransferase n=1 Tax=Vulcanisaeta distributa TaxID=164451 RepID=UPI000A437C4E|nr:precorrin-3B C(17)-methyltransferase [Vulcanisaeta distributa]